MDDERSCCVSQEQSSGREETLRSLWAREGGGGTDSRGEAATDTAIQGSSPPRCRDARPLFEPSSTSSFDSGLTLLQSTVPAPIVPVSMDCGSGHHFGSPPRDHDQEPSLFSHCDQLRRGTDSAVGSSARGSRSAPRDSFELGGTPASPSYEVDLSAALEEGLLEDDLFQNDAARPLRRARMRSRTSDPQREGSTQQRVRTDVGLLAPSPDNLDDYLSDYTSGLNILERRRSGRGASFAQADHAVGRSCGSPKDKFQRDDGKDLLHTLRKHGAVSAIICHAMEPEPDANDIWPHFRNRGKLPAAYSIIDMSRNLSEVTAPQVNYKILRQPSLMSVRSPFLAISPSQIVPSGERPMWRLPVELVEQIMKHLNRDDIKSLRLVSRELNDYTSQAAFRTVVVPFNTEIYGMLGQSLKPGSKERAKIGRPEYCWRNASGDELYNGHGLDVFRGFGRHIVRYGMSFEVNEDSISAPPLKCMTEQKTSFWGKYDWPFEEYRRFDIVAGLESAADETPRMKTAFSELTKVKELALAVDSGLGWLNGPDRSIRARILQASPGIFGNRQTTIDRRTQAQRELWNYLEIMHARAGEDIRTASLYKLEGARPLTKAQEATVLTPNQPSLPFLDSQIPHEVAPHEIVDASISQPFNDPDMFNRHILGSSAFKSGVLFTSTTLQPSDAAQISSPVIPATLSKAQKEWLLETEWAQRAFLSSYMLSIIDNRTTFVSIHTLNISRLSDRYIPVLDRADFWGSLPNLKNVTLMVVPGWRTVEKDEAGFVDTPSVDPTTQIEAFWKLLQSQVASRPGITKLTIGFTAGGEHSEGLHARNKLLMPTPLLLARVCAQADPALPSIETITLQTADMIRPYLLHLPHIEELTMRNCWITPTALLQFVKIHDECALKSLILDSVSMTAQLRRNAPVQAANPIPQPVPQNLPVAQQVGGALWTQVNNTLGGNVAAVNFQPPNHQVLTMYIQTLLVQLQNIQLNAGGAQHQHYMHALHAQLQQQLQHIQHPNPPQAQGYALLSAQNPMLQPQQQNNVVQMAHLNHLAAQVNFMQVAMGNQNAPVAAPTNYPIGSGVSMLQKRPRDGSWMNVIDQISPGTNLSDFDSPYSQADRDRTTSLTSISFKSCGYAKLPHLGPGVDQSAVEAGNDFVAALRNPVFNKRYNALLPAMMSSKWPYLGEIVQDVDLSELAALDAAWNLKHGWDDAESARAVEFDGLLSGGTGRFTGIVQRSDRFDTTDESAT